MINIEKALARNKFKALHRMLRDVNIDGYVGDFDEQTNEVIFDEWKSEVGYKTYKAPFTFNNDFTSATMTGDPIEVIDVDAYVEVSEQAVTKSWMVDFITKNFGGSSKETEVVILKQFDDVKHTTTEFVYVGPDTADGVGDAYLLEDAEPMINSLNKAIEEGRLQSGLFHKHKTKGFRVTKAWLAEKDCTMGEVEVKKNDPLMEVEYLSEKLFELRKSGQVMGPSIGARAKDIIIVDENGVEKSLGESELYLGKGNPLEAIQSDKKIKRILKGINFDWPNPEITLTDPSVGGACSLKNEIIIEKSMQPINETQQAILDEIEEEFTPIAKQLEDAVEVDNTSVNETQKETDMSVEKDQEIAELKKQLRKVDVTKAFAKYELGELEADLVELASDMEDYSVLTKALDVLVAKVEVEVTKAKEEVTPENPVLKAMSEEQGQGGEPEVEVEKSMSEKIKEAIAAQAQGVK